MERSEDFRSNNNNNQGGERGDRGGDRSNNRNRHHRHRNDRGQNRHQNREGGSFRGRTQRPLLTSAITAAGLCLIALTQVLNTSLLAQANALATAVVLFSISSIISYFAQRTTKGWVEKFSDLCFLIGAGYIVYLGGAFVGWF